MSTMINHPQPARRIPQAFICRSDLSRDRQESDFAQKEVATYVVPAIEKNGTGIEKNGTGIDWEIIA